MNENYEITLSDETSVSSADDASEVYESALIDRIAPWLKTEDETDTNFSVYETWQNRGSDLLIAAIDTEAREMGAAIRMAAARAASRGAEASVGFAAGMALAVNF